MVIFNDFSTYRRQPSWKKGKEGIAEPIVITNSHDPQHFQYSQYSFTPGSIGFKPEPSDNLEKWKDEMKEILKDQVWEITKDAAGAGLIALGTWLANPVGPEDWAFGSPLNPIDEIIGIALIWTGRFIMWA